MNSYAKFNFGLIRWNFSPPTVVVVLVPCWTSSAKDGAGGSSMDVDDEIPAVVMTRFCKKERRRC